MVNLNANAALTNAGYNVGHSITPTGMCLNFVWRMYGSMPSVGNAVGQLTTAWSAYNATSVRHTTRTVPAGYPAFLGPSPTRTDANKNAGDVIISRGDGTFVCTDASGAYVGIMTLAQRELQTRRPFVGWTEDLGGHTIVGWSGTSTSSLGNPVQITSPTGTTTTTTVAQIIEEETMFIALYQDSRGSLGLYNAAGQLAATINNGDQYLWTGKKFVHIWNDTVLKNISSVVNAANVKTAVLNQDGFANMWALLSEGSDKLGI